MPDIVISTPARLVNSLKSGNISLSRVNTLVIDEADLILSFGHADDVQSITSSMPKIYQGLLMSATLSPELEKFKRVVLHNPAVLKLEESANSGHLLQMYLRTSEADKFLVLYVFIKLGLLQGKGLIFVNDVNKCYKLKLFLQQFFISAAVLNAELPANSRTHILEEFNRGVFDYLIATDAVVDHGEEDDEGSDEEEEMSRGETGEMETIDEEGEDSDSDEDVQDEEGSENDDDIEDEENSGSEVGESDVGSDDESEDEVDEPEKVAEVPKSTVKKQRNKDDSVERDEYGVSRGIDFKGVSFVINFDFPASVAAYTHRIGRTARGGASGTSLSFVSTPPALSATSATTSSHAKALSIAERDEAVLRAVQAQQPRLGDTSQGGNNVLAALGAQGGEFLDDEDERMRQPSPLVFNMRELESFRYRVEDTIRSVTSAAVKEMRAAELKREILNSSQLKSFFAANPTDLKVLRHDKAVMHPIRVKEHLRHVPDYLVPVSMRSVAGNRNKSNKKKRRRAQAGADGQTQEKRRQISKSKDPLFAGSDEGGSASAESSSAAASQPSPAGQSRVFSNSETLGYSTSGRQKWKMAHKKGKFNPKKGKKDSLGVSGSFTKAKAYR
eukprot:CAMPEP_0185037304 /NCGR_PEP_ID=MMETSP1103-20130426/31514_1 /TAXON_ID=36769 /ORGANISM="Paraphysomonas bandaiensis, Strain Caron Lab Isolate" /LENGTH=614 /DNA_ID=CAMNT_0027575225 /DNA_START=381 /DNA_END=2225 /DNA_ORIENTATION=-